MKKNVIGYDEWISEGNQIPLELKGLLSTKIVGYMTFPVAEYEGIQYGTKFADGTVEQLTKEFSSIVKMLVYRIDNMNGVYTVRYATVERVQSEQQPQSFDRSMPPPPVWDFETKKFINPRA